jgi:DNA-binding protein HU-beta
VNKTDLINKLAERLEGDKKAAQSAVEGVIDLIVREVARGGSVSISGFGVYEKRARAARTARNPRTGEAVKVKKTTVPAFRPGKLFREVVAGTVKLPKVAGAPTSARATAAAARGGAAAKTAPAAAAPKPAVRTPRATAAKAAPAAAAPKPAVRTPRATAAKTAPAAAKTAAPKAAAVKATPKAAAPKVAAAKPAPKAAAPKATAPKAAAAKTPARRGATKA